MHNLPANFTEEQRTAATLLDRPMALLAAAGSGKTTVLVHRYLSLLGQGRQPSQILTVTFTNEAADQLRGRIAGYLKETGGVSEKTLLSIETTPNIGTIHGFCYQLLNQYGTVIGLPGISGILTPFELAGGLDEAYRDWLEQLPSESLRFLLGHFTHTEIKMVVSELFQNRFVLQRAIKQMGPTAGGADVEIVSKLVEWTAPLFSRLESQFSGNGLYSFDDLEHLALRILRESPEVRGRLQSEITHLLVDEFQDTSRLQWELLQLVTDRDPCKLFVVGDPKQSIYSFRHADVRLFLSVTKELANKGGVVHELSANFRSAPRLLAEINRLARALFEGSEIPFAEMQPGLDEVEPSSGNEPLKIRRYGAEEKSELSIAEIRETVSAARELIERGEAPGQIAILFRVADRIPAYFEALTAAGIPAFCKQTARLFECYDIVDLMSFLKAVENPLDSFSLAAFLRSPFVGFDHSKLWTALEAPGETLYEKLLGLSSGELGWFFALIESGEYQAEAVLGTLFQNSRYFPGQTEAVLEWLAPLAGRSWNVTDAVRRLQAWENEETLFTHSSGTHLGKEGVHLMTVHGAKGLEFPHVFLVDNLRQMPRRSPPLRLHPDFPVGLRYRVEGEPVTSQSYDLLSERQHSGDLEESKRILYVALTRAQKTLTLFLPSSQQMIPKGSWAAFLGHGN